MRIADLYGVFDPFIPVWINNEGNCTRYDTFDEVRLDYMEEEVLYVTLDGNHELTIEI